MTEDREITLIDHVEELGTFELLEEGQALAETEERISVAKAELKKITADHKARISEIETDRTRLSRIIRTKQRELVTECYADPDFNAGVMVFSSVETGQVVEERALTNAERQMKIIDMENSADSGVNSEGFVEELVVEKVDIEAAASVTAYESLSDEILALENMNYLQLKSKAKELQVETNESLDAEGLRDFLAAIIRNSEIEDLSALGDEA